MSSKRFITIYGYIFFHAFIHDSVLAQTENDRELEQIIESVVEQAGEDFDYSEFAERLNHYKWKPINLNKARKEQLQELLFLSPLQINSLLKHSEINGDFIDLLELQSVEGMDLKTIQSLLPFITISIPVFSNLSFQKLLPEGHNDLMFRYGQVLEKQNGFLIPDARDKTHYTGSPQRLLTRYRYNYKNILSAGLAMEKDAGEQFFSGKQRNGFDFYSGFLSYKGGGYIKKIIAGDYSLQFGQGLTLWSGLSFGKGASIATIAKQDLGLREYTSANEALFLRGTAATLAFKKTSITPFVSYRYLDGSLNGDSTKISSINQSGFHRTETEQRNKNRIEQLIYGSNIQYDKRSFKTGFIIYHTRFNYSFEQGTLQYNKFDFSGSALTNIGWYYNYNWRNFYFFGEAAHSLSSGYAYLTGAMVSLYNPVSLVMLYRDYQKKYYSFFNQSLAESTSGSNEKGFYSGLVIVPSSKLELSCYSDFFRFPWLKFGVDAPSKGNEYLLQLSYTPSKKLKALLRYKREDKEENDDIDNQTNFLETASKQNYRGELSYKINTTFQLRNRIEVTQYKKGLKPEELGYLMYQDIFYSPSRTKFSSNIRFAIFDTQGFNSRVYSYENDVLYGFSIPGFQDKGIRFYINGRYKIKRGIDVWLKYSITNFINKDEIGSGLDLIKGSNKSDIKAQIRLQF
jgi:hypothetical protein